MGRVEASSILGWGEGRLGGDHWKARRRQSERRRGEQLLVRKR